MDQGYSIRFDAKGRDMMEFTSYLGKHVTLDRDEAKEESRRVISAMQEFARATGLSEKKIEILDKHEVTLSLIEKILLGRSSLFFDYSGDSELLRYKFRDAYVTLRINEDKFKDGNNFNVLLPFDAEDGSIYRNYTHHYQPFKSEKLPKFYDDMDEVIKETGFDRETYRILRKLSAGQNRAYCAARALTYFGFIASEEMNQMDQSWQKEFPGVEQSVRETCPTEIPQEFRERRILERIENSKDYHYAKQLAQKGYDLQGLNTYLSARSHFETCKMHGKVFEKMLEKGYDCGALHR